MKQKPNFLSYDDKSYSFWIDKGVTTENEVGGYIIKVELSNSGGGSAIYSFSVVIKAHPEVIVIEEEDSNAKLSPVPSISKVSERGVITI